MAKEKKDTAPSEILKIGKASINVRSIHEGKTTKEQFIKDHKGVIVADLNDVWDKIQAQIKALGLVKSATV